MKFQCELNTLALIFLLLSCILILLLVPGRLIQCLLSYLKLAEEKSNCFLPFRHLLSSFSSHCMVLRRVLFFSFSFSYFFFHCSAVSSTLTQTVFLMVFALHRKSKKIQVDLIQRH
uniref:Uncharacterized protein n=1 Tax=Melopsittacus undulatus TaxID=13146 RepID=A0A8C6J614_MELUD